MTIEEWKQTASPEAIAQYEAPVDWFKHNVKCCYNCPHWQIDRELVYEYMYNPCEYIGCEDGKLRMTPFDAYCEKYGGVASTENLLDYAHLEKGWERKEE